MASFEELVLLLQTMTDVSASDRRITGRLFIANSAVFDALDSCAKAPADIPLTVTGTPAMGAEVEIELETIRPAFGFVAKTLDELLKAPKARLREPENYYLLDGTSRSGTPELYMRVLEFVALLKSAAAFLDVEEECLVFIHNGKFEVPVVYNLEQLKRAQLGGLDRLKMAMVDDAHSKQRESILSASVIEMCASVPLENRFSELLRRANELASSFERGYGMFASGFSYEKIRDEIESARIEYTGKIHKVFSDIQNQLLGIPAAAVVIATQIKDASERNAIYYTNVVVLLASFVFFTLMSFLLHNQRQTLSVIRVEIDRQFSRIKQEYSAVANGQLGKSFGSLTSRLRSQCIALWAVQVVALGVLLATMWQFFSVSAPAKDWLFSLFSSRPGSG